jgi:hypothetical protein
VLLTTSIALSVPWGTVICPNKGIVTDPTGIKGAKGAVSKALFCASEGLASAGGRVDNLLLV